MKSEDNNGWHEWSKHVLKELERLDRTQKDIFDQFDKFRVRFDGFREVMVKDMESLKVKVAIWSGVAGLIGSSVASIAVSTFLYWLIGKHP